MNLTPASFPSRIAKTTLIRPTGRACDRTYCSRAGSPTTATALDFIRGIGGQRSGRMGRFSDFRAASDELAPASVPSVARLRRGETVSGHTASSVQVRLPENAVWRANRSISGASTIPTRTTHHNGPPLSVNRTDAVTPRDPRHAPAWAFGGGFVRESPTCRNGAKSAPDVEWWSLDTGWACGALIVRDGRIVDCAPIYRRRLKGRPLSDARRVGRLAKVGR